MTAELHGTENTCTDSVPHRPSRGVNPVYGSILVDDIEPGQTNLLEPVHQNI
nr:hypothetical protein [Burkholderia ambifaria]